MAAWHLHHTDDNANEVLELAQPVFLKVLERLYVPGMETDDLLQEMRMHVFESLPTYDTGKSSANSWIYMISWHFVVTRLKHSQSSKQRALNSATEYDDGMSVDGDVSHHDEPAYEAERQTLATMRREGYFTPLERAVMDAIVELDDHSYESIGRHIRQPFKSVDNALSRIRRKVDAYTKTAHHRRNAASKYSDNHLEFGLRPSLDGHKKFKRRGLTQSEYNREYYQRLKRDPEKLAARRAYQREWERRKHPPKPKPLPTPRSVKKNEYNRRSYAKLMADPAKRAKRREQMTQTMRLWRKRQKGLAA